MKILKIVLAAVLAVAFSVPAGVAIADGGERHERHSYTAKFYGVIDNMPQSGHKGKWTVNGRDIVVTVISEKD